MNSKLSIAIERFLSENKATKFHGEEENEANFALLGDELQIIFPVWYRELLVKYPIDGLIIDINVDTDDERSLEFVGFEGVADEFYDLYPGCAIGELGYLCIAEDPTGGGDPYFISIHEGDNPPVYQIYHDVSSVGEEIIRNGKEKIANQLSDLFKIE